MSGSWMDHTGKVPGGTADWSQEVSVCSRALTGDSKVHDAFMACLLLLTNIMRGLTQDENYEQDMPSSRKRGAGESCCKISHSFHAQAFDAAGLPVLLDFLREAPSSAKITGVGRAIRWLLRMGIVYGTLPAFFYGYVGCFYGLEAIALFFFNGPLVEAERKKLKSLIKDNAARTKHTLRNHPSIADRYPRNGFAPYGGRLVYWVPPNIEKVQEFASFRWKDDHAGTVNDKDKNNNRDPTVFGLFRQAMEEHTEMDDEQITKHLRSFWHNLLQGESALAPWSGSPLRIEVYTTTRRDKTDVLIAMGDAIPWAEVAAAGPRAWELRHVEEVFQATSWSAHAPLPTRRKVARQSEAHDALYALPWAGLSQHKRYKSGENKIVRALEKLAKVDTQVLAASTGEPSS